MADDLMIYMIGEPGSGKSTLMARLTEPWSRHPADGQPRRDLLLEGETVRGVELGKRRAGGFSGTDALGSSVITVAERWLYQHEAPIVLGEGARLGNARFLKAGVDAGYRVTLVLLEHGDSARWRAARSEALGRTQNAAWVKGRATASRRLADHPPAGVGVLRGHPDNLYPILSERLGA